jgi:homoprotocatechuate degradation regulator HpaR
MFVNAPELCQYFEMTDPVSPKLPPYSASIAGTLLAAREAVMAPIRPHLREAGVTEQQWRVLRVLMDRDMIDISTLATMALLHAPSVTRILKEFAERGLIERHADSNDSRRSYITITQAGRDLVNGTAEHTVVCLRAYSEAFGHERLEALLKELAAFSQSIEPFSPKE